MANDERFVALKVEIPGNQHARYEADQHTGDLQLVDVVYPGQRFPGDLCAACGTLTENDRPLAVFLLGNVSHHAGCRLKGRVLGMLEVASEEGEQEYLVAVAAGDGHFADIQSIKDLSELRRQQVTRAFQVDGMAQPVTVRWRDTAAGEILLRRTRKAYRLAQNEQSNLRSLGPAWKPPSRHRQSRPESEAEPHTAAEHAFRALPFRFQEYVGATLADDERIVYGLQRQAMHSALHSSFWRSKRLEEAVFVISTQQIVKVAELMPPDRAGIRYGFVARCGLPERLQNVELHQFENGVIGLQLTWRGSGGIEQIIWEFRGEQRQAVEQAVSLLRNWLPHPDDRRLQRATLPNAPEEFTPLYDPAANDPEETRGLAVSLEEQLSQTLVPGEAVLARCLLPAWIKERGAPSVLAVTSRRLLAVAEPAGDRLRLDIPLHAITSFELSSTLLRSYLKIFVPKDGVVKEYVIHFAKTLAAMDDCFLALRQATGVTPPLIESIQQSRKGERYENHH